MNITLVAKLIGFVLGIVFGMCSPAQAEETIHLINKFSDAAKKVLTGDNNWKRCGNYFAAVELPGARLVHFSFAKNLVDQVIKVPVFPRIDDVTVSIDKKLAAPMVVIRKEGLGRPQYTLWLNSERNSIGAIIPSSLSVI